MLDSADEVDSDFLNKEEKPEEENQSSSSDSDIDKYASYMPPPRSACLVVRSLFIWSLVVDNVTISSQLPIRISAGIFASATVIWLLFEGLGYHLLTFVCHSLTLSLATLFLWSNLASSFNMSPPEFPEVSLPEDLFVKIALLLRSEVNRASATFRDVASGKDLKKFLSVTVTLWALSVVGSWFSFLTLFYLVFLMLLTVPMLYEKHEDTVDAYAGEVLAEIKRQYAVLDEKVLQKLPAALFHHKQR